MLNPVHLRTLTAVIRTGSFADAARQLGYTASAVSQQIAALERAVQLPLFERDAHSITATPAAEFLAERARDSLSALDGLDDDVRGLVAGELGRLRLGSFPTASERLLPGGLAAYRQAHPDVRVELDEGEPAELVALLRDGELDVAVVYRYDLVPQRWPAGLTRTPLVEERLVLLLPDGHRLAGEQTVTLADLEDETWVRTREGSSGATCLDRICAEADFVPQVSVRSNDYDVIREFVRSGLGIALVPALAHVPAEGIVARSLDDVDVRRHVLALHRPIGAGPSAPAAVDALTSAATDVAAGTEGVEAT
ncbi:LysR family transcriptional regulator [Nocardioidaceae bacterium SCSIO 66511]|nr:LysR family transcriptional regulator [Nocardioidaceae bacterium SCSIO 66511]